MLHTLERAGGVSLRRLLPGSRFFGGQDISATSCCGESDRVEHGDLFVAIDDGHHDGHDRFRDAIDRGASAILAERLLPAHVPVCVVDDSRTAYGRLCHALAGDPAQDMRVVGITGTSGKTTTSLLLTSILNTAELRTGFTNSIARNDFIDIEAASRTTPAPPELANWMTRMAANGCTHAVVEASSEALAQRRTAGVQFDAAILTNLRRDHLDVHNSVMNYRRAKARLFEQLSPNGFAVVNADDRGSQHVLRKLACPVITFGLREPAEVTATVVERHKSEQTFLLSAGNDCTPVRTSIVGDQHVSNCLAAAAVALVMGVELTVIAKGLEAIGRVPGRMERIECGQSFGVFVDTSDTADRLAVALKSLRKVTEGRLICVFGSDSRAEDEGPLLGRVLERATDVGIITGGSLDQRGEFDSIHSVLDGYDRPARAHVIPTRSQAIEWALSEARAEDTVLIAGQSETAWDKTGHARSFDSELARTRLYKMAGDEPATIAMAKGTG